MSATTAVEMPEIGATGLTSKEVVQRIESGQSNAVKTSTSRSVQDIVRANVFTLFNGIIFAAMVLVLITGSWRDAVFGFVIIINTGIGIVTELRAKRTLDKLSILVASEFLVHRDGRDVEVPHNEIVLDDLLWIRAGEQVPADGQIIQTWGLELDESMLTGESRTVRHKVGEQVYSGATAVSGMALVKVNAVGSHSYAATLTAQAKVYKKTVSDLNKGINTILKFMTFLVVPLCILLILSQIHTVGGWGTALSTGEWRQAVVSAVAGVVGMIPEGLVLLTSLNFAVAAMRLARHNTLVQELESVETLARVDALNLDKTGTITDGGIAFNRLVMLDSANAAAEQAATQALYDCCNEEQPNGTGQAVLAGLKAQGYGAGAVESRVPFSSARKWSAVRKSGETWYMGAPEVIISALEGDYSSVLQQVNEYANDGNRVLLVARSTAPLSEGSCRQKRLRGAVEGANVSDGRQLDVQAEPVALVLCSEKIREDAERTLAWFREQGVRCRVISGDNPVTVGAIARRVKLTGDHEPVAMDARELPEDVNELARVLENVDVLGRVLPDQKKAIVQALHTQNHVVAMTGDGVNDALAIKEADLGIAMGNAAPATKAVAQVVLVDSKFSHLPERRGAGPSGHGQYGARGQPVPRQNRVLRADLARRSADANPIPIPAAPYHVYRRSHHRHARVHSGARAEHAPLYSGIPQARGHVRAAGRHRHRAVGAAGRLGAAAGHGLERDRRCRGPVRPARHQRHHPVRDGRVRAGPRGQTTQRLAWRAGGGVRGGGRNRRVRPVRGELLRPDSADRRHDGGHADRVGRFRADLRAVPVAGAARARTDGQALASALRRRRDCLILQADTPEPR